VTRRRRFARWFERVVLGAVMSVIAFVIERRVLKAIRAKGEEPATPERKGELTPGTQGPQVRA
jgi:flagellar biosynthesis/type III secretory pathway M-ring protein FliF/YscJ